MKHSQYYSLPIIFIFIFVYSIHGNNLILSVSSEPPSVGHHAIITVTFSAGNQISALSIRLPNKFTISHPSCTANESPVTCDATILSADNTVEIRYYDEFSAGTNTVTLTATNPYYDSQFLINGFEGATKFISSAYLAINSVDITCSVTSDSKLVGQATSTTFSIGFQTLHAHSLGKIEFIAHLSSGLPAVFADNPICMLGTVQYDCNVTQNSETQILTIRECPVGGVVTFMNYTINFLNNPPYNSTFEDIEINVLDSNSRNVQKCTVTQPAPTILQESGQLTIQGWQSTVGATSTVEILLNTYFPPLSDSIVLLVYPELLRISPQSPSSSESETSQGTTSLSISSFTYQSNLISINASVVNPSSTIPLTLTSYVLYNTTHFRQHKQIDANSLQLTPQTVSISSMASMPETLTPTSLNITLQSPITVTSSFVLTVSVEHGQIACSNPSLVSSFTQLTQSSCSTRSLQLNATSGFSAGAKWVQFGYVTAVSTISNVVHVQIEDENGYGIMAGNTVLIISISSPDFNVLSSNTTYTAMTEVDLIETNITVIDQGVVRKFMIVPPLYMSITADTTVEATSAETQLVSPEIQTASNTVIVSVKGRLSVQLTNMRNPAHYLGSRQWTITANDSLGNPSISSTSIQPPYSTVTSSITIASSSNSTILQPSRITIQIQSVLEYNMSDAPTVTVQFSQSSISSVDGPSCPNCQIRTRTMFAFPYFHPIMQVTVEVQNSENPFNNSVSFEMTLNRFVYESGSVSYELEPTAYNYTSQFTGVYGELGSLTINLTTNIARNLIVQYTGSDSIFSSDIACQICNSTYLQITGITGYFASGQITVEGYSQGVLYARAIIPVSYRCSALPGCQICSTLNTTLICSKCFSQSLTTNYLLHADACYSGCPVRTYADGVVCRDCTDLCYRCAGQDSCMECEIPYSVYLETCVQDCPPDYIKNATHCLPRPIICPQNCVDCPEDNQCNKCDAEFYLLEDLCYSECPQNYITSSDSVSCELFVPPEETDYFPFAFLLTSLISLVVLLTVKIFEKRSLVIGNFTAICSFFELGALIMMVSYTFISIWGEPQRWANSTILTTQALLFIAVLTKVLLNLFFAVYFLRNISKDDNFINWRQQSEQNNRLYTVLLVLSSVFTFQMMRVLYCRLLGLQLFFGRFNTSLIFKPMNYFSMASILPAACLIGMAINNIVMQNGYKTPIFYSSIELVLIELLGAVGWLMEMCRSDQDYFDYQVYKVENLHDECTASKIPLGYQEESGSSLNQILQSQVQANNSQKSNNPSNQKDEHAMSTGKLWRIKDQKNVISEDENESERVSTANQPTGSANQPISNPNQSISSTNQAMAPKNKSRSFLRTQILKQWQQLHQGLVKPRSRISKKNDKPVRKSTSPSQTQKNDKNTHKSLQKIEVHQPQISYENRGQYKKHYYEITQKDGQSEQSIEPSNKKAEEDNPQRSGIQNQEQGIKQNQVGQSTSKNKVENTEGLKIENDISEINNEQSQSSIGKSLLELENKIKPSQYGDSEQYGFGRIKQNRFGDFEQDGGDRNRTGRSKDHEQNDSNRPSRYREFKQDGLAGKIKPNRYEDFERQGVDELQDQDKILISQKRQVNPRSSDYRPSRRKIKKKYMNKQAQAVYVNKQTEAVYLQRLLSSEATKRPNQQRKLDDF